jgi:pimeloyl-ACP methyl ester carboxylesterase
MATLQLPGAGLYYEVDGQGTPVTLVHGMALDARMWDDQVPALSGIARVIRYDARGFGRSPRQDNHTAYTHADDLWALLDHLDVASTVLVGLSMGGATVVEATLQLRKECGLWCSSMRFWTASRGTPKQLAAWTRYQRA